MFNHNFFYLVSIMLFFFYSCASSSANKAYCDKNIKCLDGYECVKNKCEKAEYECSLKNKYGYCKEEDKECYDGVCKTLKEAKCEDINCDNHGVCDINNNKLPYCICEEGYHPVKLRCVKDGVTLCGGVECAENEHCENNVCTNNTKLVQCDRDIDIPENAEIIITQFEITWSSGEWEKIDKCEWACKQGYAKDETGQTCIKESEKCSFEHPTGICEEENYICLNGECSPPPTMGAMCQTQSQCPQDMICILNGVENGYCTKRRTNDDDCGDYKCGEFLNAEYCLQACNNILDCRSDFTCNNDKLCRPKCTSDEQCEEYQKCDLDSGLCVIQDVNCDVFSDNACSDSQRACYPFDDLGHTACALKGDRTENKFCLKDNDCQPASKCLEVPNLTGMRCKSLCKPSRQTDNGNPNCEPYSECNPIEGWTDLGYCEYNPALKPVGLECISDYDCDFSESGTCMVFERYNICVAEDCPQQGAINDTLFKNEVMCVGMNVGGTWKMYWMDTCETDSDCYSEHFYCYENTTYPYPRKYCRPRP